MTERAAAEGRVEKIEFSWRNGLFPLHEDRIWLIAELRAAWAREDEAAIKLVREQVKFEKKSLEAGYRRGLAAARAAVAKEIPACRCDAGFKDRGLTDPDCSRCEFGDDVLAVIDALLAEAEGKCIKMFNKKLETQGQ